MKDEEQLPKLLVTAFEGEREALAWTLALSAWMVRELSAWVIESKSEASKQKRAERMAERLMLTMEAERELPGLLVRALDESGAMPGWKSLTPMQRRMLLLAVYRPVGMEGRERQVRRMVDASVAKIPADGGLARLCWCGKGRVMMQIEELGQIGLTVTELDRSKAFYGGALGMKFLFDAGTMAFYQCGPVRLMLGLPEAGQAVPVGGTILYFRVSEIEAVCDELKAKGLEFVQGAHVVAKMADHVLWMAFLKDPDGNPLGLMEEVR